MKEDLKSTRNFIILQEFSHENYNEQSISPLNHKRYIFLRINFERMKFFSKHHLSNFNGQKIT